MTIAADSADLTVVQNWVTQLASFNGVPLNYLVPDIGMLPMESLRLFQVDTNWLGTLIAGALSVGGPVPAALQQAVASQLQQAGLAGPMSGFLLRSSIVTTWPNTTAVAYADTGGGTALPVLQLTELSSTMLFGLFGGTLQRLDLCQPQQTLHFGADVSGGAVTVELRYAGGSTQVTAGSSTGTSQNVTQRSTQWTPATGPAVAGTTGNGTLEIKDFATAIAQSVWGPDVKQATLTSAELGLQFVQVAEAVSFEPGS
jgi:hypothetical protein